MFVAHRIGGRRLMLAMAAVLAVAIRGYGLSVLTHPWNPYFPLILWLLTMLSALAVLAGHPKMFVVTVVAGSIAAQTHVPYLLLATSMCALGLGVLTWRWARGRNADDGPAMLA